MSSASYGTGTSPTAMAINPYDPLLYVANTGGESGISAFQIDEASGALFPVVGSPFLSGANVSSLAFGGLISYYLYAASATGDSAAIYGFVLPFGPNGDPNGNPGALTPLAGYPYSLPSCTFIVTDRNGAYLYATTGTSLVGYSIDATTGALRPLAGFPIAMGANVRPMSIDPTNHFLYVANGSAGTVTSFTLNAATGALTPMPGSPFAVGTSTDFITTF